MKIPNWREALPTPTAYLGKILTTTDKHKPQPEKQGSNNNR